MGRNAIAPNTTPVPATRADCPISRPCGIHRCRHNLAVEEERPGRPHGGRRPLPIVVEKAESCALDVCDREPDGLEPEAITTLLGMSMRRLQQIQLRAGLKIQVAQTLLDHADELADKLPAGSFCEAVFHGPGENPEIVTTTFVIRIAKVPTALERVPARRITPEAPIRITRDEHAAMRRTDPDRPRREGVARARERRAAVSEPKPTVVEPGQRTS